MAIQSDHEFAPTQIARAVFPTAFRGYDQDAVRRFLSRLAAALEHQQEYAGLGELEARTPAHERVEELEVEIENLRDEIKDLELELVQRSVDGKADQAATEDEVAAGPDGVGAFDEHRAIELLGQETARVLESARSAAADILKRAETQAATMKAQAKTELTEARKRAEQLAADRQSQTHELVEQLTAEAEANAERLATEADEHRAAVLEESTKILSEAETRSEKAQGEAETRAKQIVADAETLRQQVISELVVERRQAQGEMNQMVAARDRLAMSLAVARSELDEVADSLVDVSTIPLGADHADPEQPGHLVIEVEQSAQPPELDHPAKEPEDQDADADAEAGVDADAEVGVDADAEVGVDADAEVGVEPEDGMQPELDLRDERAGDDGDDTGDEVDGEEQPGSSPAEAGSKSGGSTATRKRQATKTKGKTKKQKAKRAPTAQAELDAAQAAIVTAEIDPEAIGAGLAAQREAAEAPIDELERPVPIEDDAPPIDETTAGDDIEIELDTELDLSPDPDLDPVAGLDEMNELPADGGEFSLVEGFTTLELTEEERVAAGEVDQPADTAVAGEQKPADEVITTVASRTAVAQPDRNRGDLPLAESYTGRLPKQFAARDVALAQAGPNFRRQLRRALNDDQSEVLDRLRAGRGDIKVDELPAFADQIDRYLAPLRRGLAEIAQAGAKAGGRDELSQTALDNLVRQLAKYIVDKVRIPTIQVLQETVDQDRERILEPVRALYRDFRNVSLPELTEDALYEAFAIGLYDSIQPEAPVRWVIDPRTDPDPVCEINRGRSDVVKGEVFPSGHARPLSLPGCRCLVATGS